MTDKDKDGDNPPRDPELGEPGREPPLLEATVTDPNRPPPRAPSPLVPGLVGGIVGALLALGAGWVLGPGVIDDRVQAGLASFRPTDQLELRIAALESAGEQVGQLVQTVDALGARAGQLEALLAGEQKDAESLAARVAAIEGQLAGPRVNPTAIEELRSRIAAVDERLLGLENRPLEGPQLDLSPVTGGLDELRQGLAQSTTRLDQLAAETATLAGRVDTLTTAVGETEKRLVERAQVLADRLTAAESALTARSTQLAEAQSALATLQTGQSRQASDLAATGTTLAELRDRLITVATEVDGRVGAVEQNLTQRLNDALASLDARAARDTGTIVTAVALAEVGRALEDGTPFPAAIDLLRAHGGDDPALGRAAELLEPSAATGVATRTRLRQELAALKLRPGEAAGDWVEQTKQNVLGLISIRREDQVGDRDDVRLAGEALDRGDLPAAIRLVEGLRPGPTPEADAAIEAWLAAARARVAAEEARSVLREQLGRLVVPAG